MPVDIKQIYKNKKVGFVGLGVSNLPTAKMFAQKGFDVTLRDKKVQEPVEGFKCIFGDNYLEDITEDILFLAPVINVNKCEPLIEVQKKGVLLTTEMQEFFKYCPCKKIAVTGSDGKTTTTTIIAKLLEQSGQKVFLGGNIGYNLFEKLDEITENDYAVCELSSFQLIKMNISPDIAVLKNIAPNHLDWHTDMQEYIEAKTNIFKYQDEKGVLVISADNEITKQMLNQPKSKVVPTSGTELLENGVSYLADGIYVGNEKWLDDSDIFLVGRHNRNNYADAIAATLEIVSKADALAVARSFTGVKHRIQYVKTVNGVKYYNSSIDSSPSRTFAALNSFNQKVIVICGGYDKKIPYEPLGELFRNKVKIAVTMGATGEKIRNVLKDCAFEGAVLSASDMADAVSKAHSLAQEGDIVILSPASASFDMFKNFEERGNVFINEVEKLI